MTKTDAQKIVAYLSAVYPREGLEPETVAVWVAEVAELHDGQLAMEVAKGIARSQDRLPSLAWFRQEYILALKQRSESHGLPAPEPEVAPPPPEAVEMMERLGKGTILRSI